MAPYIYQNDLKITGLRNVFSNLEKAIKVIFSTVIRCRYLFMCELGKILIFPNLFVCYPTQEGLENWKNCVKASRRLLDGTKSSTARPNEFA